MSYQDFEPALELGTPVELYEFIQGAQRWFYISNTVPLVRLGQTYTPEPISRDRIKQTNDVFKDGLKLKFPRENVFASQFLGFAPEEITTVTILRGHYGDPDDEYIVYWKGRVVGAKAGGNEIEIECESVFTSIRRPGLRAKFEYGCRHTLYGRACSVNREAYRYDNTVNSIVGGVRVEVQGAGNFPAGYFTGGILIAPNGAERFIVDQDGDTITMNRPIRGFVGSVTVSLYPGCDHLRSTCQTKFNNLDNFGGFPWIPRRNPFDGSSIV